MLADPNVRVYALTTGPRWPDVSGNVLATGSRAELTGDTRRGWLAARPRTNERSPRHGNSTPPRPTGLHVAAAVGDGAR